MTDDFFSRLAVGSTSALTGRHGPRAATGAQHRVDGALIEGDVEAAAPERKLLGAAVHEPHARLGCARAHGDVGVHLAVLILHARQAMLPVSGHLKVKIVNRPLDTSKLKF